MFIACLATRECSFDWFHGATHLARATHWHEGDLRALGVFPHSCPAAACIVPIDHVITASCCLLDIVVVVVAILSRDRGMTSCATFEWNRSRMNDLIKCDNCNGAAGEQGCQVNHFPVKKNGRNSYSLLECYLCLQRVFSLNWLIILFFLTAIGNTGCGMHEKTHHTGWLHLMLQSFYRECCRREGGEIIVGWITRDKMPQRRISSETDAVSPVATCSRHATVTKVPINPPTAPLSRV